jgi:hypothetical protein
MNIILGTYSGFQEEGLCGTRVTRVTENLKISQQIIYMESIPKFFKYNRFLASLIISIEHPEMTTQNHIKQIINVNILSPIHASNN